MRSIPIKIIALSALSVAVFFNPLNAQTDDPFGGDPFGGDPFGGMIDSSAQAPLPPLDNFGTQPSSRSNTSSAGSQNTPQYPFSESTIEPEIQESSNFQNAIIEGIQ